MSVTVDTSKITDNLSQDSASSLTNTDQFNFSLHLSILAMQISGSTWSKHSPVAGNWQLAGNAEMSATAVQSLHRIFHLQKLQNPASFQHGLPPTVQITLSWHAFFFFPLNVCQISVILCGDFFPHSWKVLNSDISLSPNYIYFKLWWKTTMVAWYFGYLLCWN